MEPFEDIPHTPPRHNGHSILRRPLSPVSSDFPSPPTNVRQHRRSKGARMSSVLQSGTSTPTPESPQRRRSRTPEVSGSDKRVLVSPSLILGFSLWAYPSKFSPAVKTRLVEQQGLATRQAIDEKDVEIQRLQQQVSECSLYNCDTEFTD